ncbi:MAG TPA: carboxypeptidase-like regulatory domain-containing protein, partial [Pyrinomonadaceae bacterium]
TNNNAKSLKVSADDSDLSPQTVNVTVGDATITFPGITTAGATQEIPLNLTVLPPLPSGTSSGLTYDIATSAVYAGSPTVCFNLPALATVFPNLRIYHLEGFAWVNRTAASGNTPSNFCTTPLSSLSPFAIIQAVPTAATVSISGRVIRGKDIGLLNAIVVMTDSQGNTRTARSSSFGYYRFDEVAVGENYVLSISSKRYQFAPQVVFVDEEREDLDFLALP